MKLFGEFLLSRKAITEEQLLGALILQAKKLPPLCEIAHESKAFNSKALLAILSEQTRHRAGFIEASKALGLWNDEVSTQIDSMLTKSRTPLGKILAEQGVLSWDNVSKLLDEFWSELEEADIKPVSKPSIEAAPKSAAVETYLETFSEAKKSELENLLVYFSTWGTTIDSDQQAILMAAKDAVHLLQGSARLAKVTQSEAIFSSIEDCLGKVVSHTGPFEEAVFSKLSETTVSALASAWKIRGNLETTDKEQE